MEGKLKKTDKGWVVNYFDTGKAHDIMYCGESLPLHPNDVKQIQEDSQIFDNIDARISTYPDVEFEIVEVFDKNSQIGHRHINYAKLIDEKERCEYSGLPSVTSYDESEYPELEGTMNLCNDKIWDDINHDYTAEQYPAFGGPFTDSISFIDWLKQNYKAPERIKL